MQVAHSVHWLAARSPRSKKLVSLIPTHGLSVWSLRVLPVSLWVLSWNCGFLPQSKGMHIRLTGNKIVCERESGWLFVSLCCHLVWAVTPPSTFQSKTAERVQDNW